MSCGCNNSTYSNTCCQEVPYPSISAESVPSLISNPVGINAGSFGQITIASGAAVTVPSGGVWTVV